MFAICTLFFFSLILNNVAQFGSALRIVLPNTLSRNFFLVRFWNFFSSF